jgi:hypothetical protein
MTIYKITFVNNEILSCSVIEEVLLKEKYSYEHHKGYLIHAFVKAESEADARKTAHKIVKEFESKKG